MAQGVVSGVLPGGIFDETAAKCVVAGGQEVLDGLADRRLENTSASSDPGTSGTSPGGLGEDLEKLLLRAFELARFAVKLGPGIAQPHLTDLSARYGERRYLLECK
ncbi:hypothetical protein [Streptomyces sp. NRRL WC-3549]|uniref:hypothetical protein n=1 Tax=Streptomyces sp. NRRL WC-3549 TaxID=1463925 RepID=UPI00131B6A52|nr:hypothetical protein [Streptomyces sp. NRRL WC-3549]